MNNIFELLESINFFQTEFNTGLNKPEAIFFDWENTIVKGKSQIKNNDCYLTSFDLGNCNPLKSRNYNKDNLLCQVIEPQELNELLSFINEQNIFCGIISNKDRRRLNKEVQELNLKKYFQKIVGAGDCQSLKPMIDPIILALAETEIEFGKNIWIIGDSASDIEFATISLSTGILYNSEKKINNFYHSNNSSKKAELEKNHSLYKPDLEISSMKEITNILRSMFTKADHGCFKN